METYDLLITLLKNLISRFKKECQVVVLNMLNCLIENGSETKYPKKLFMNMGELILLIPRFYED